jgi:hypothetical protein
MGFGSVVLELAKREGDRASHEHQEHWENQIVKTETFPLDVLELIAETFCPSRRNTREGGGRKESQEFFGERIGSHDPEHVKASERIDR